MARSVNRVFVGNLPLDCSESEVTREFERFGTITRIDLKRTTSGNQFAFIEYSDSRDAEDAIAGRHGHDFKGFNLRVEIPFKERGERVSYKSFRGRPGPVQRGKYVVEVSGLPPSGSWQDLKDHLREAGQCGHADTYGDGTGEITFFSRMEMETAIDKFNGSSFRSHEGERSRITLREKSSYHNGDHRNGRDYSRSRSPYNSRSRSPYSRSRSPSDRYSKGHSRYDKRDASRDRYKRRNYSASSSPDYRRSKRRSRSYSKSSSRSR